MTKLRKAVKRPRPAPRMREGKAATEAFKTALRQSLNPLPEKKHKA